LTPVEDEWAPLRRWTKVVDDRARVTQLQQSIRDVITVGREENSEEETPLEPDQPDQLEKERLARSGSTLRHSYGSTRGRYRGRGRGY
jgi:hypothetical protein